MIYISNEDFKNFEHVYKINLINSCSGYKSANLIGTKSASGQENVAVFSSVIHLGSNPPLLGFVCRPTTVTRHTYENIKETKFYTLNHIHSEILEDAHHTSAKYEREISEFDKTKLTSEYKGDFHAPFVMDCPLQIAMEYVSEYLIYENNVILVIGKIIGLYAQDDIIKHDGFIDLTQGKIAAINGLDGYAVPENNARFDYQRPAP
ncbi:MAG: flavin reductase [Bacteroidota bacterium]